MKIIRKRFIYICKASGELKESDFMLVTEEIDTDDLKEYGNFIIWFNSIIIWAPENCLPYYSQNFYVLPSSSESTLAYVPIWIWCRQESQWLAARLQSIYQNSRPSILLHWKYLSTLKLYTESSRVNIPGMWRTRTSMANSDGKHIPSLIRNERMAAKCIHCPILVIDRFH